MEHKCTMPNDAPEGHEWETVKHGYPVRVYATDGGTEANNIHGAVRIPNGNWVIRAWEPTYFVEQVRDKPVEYVRYVNMYPRSLGNVHATKKQAEGSAGEDRLACVRVDFAEGQFDE